MKIAYFDLLSPYGFQVDGVGRIHSPILRDIAQKGYKEYQYALTILLMSPKEYIESISKATGMENFYEKMSQAERDGLNIFDMYIRSESNIKDIEKALSFFISGKVSFYEKRNVFLVNPMFSEKSISADGVINSKNWGDVCEVCLKSAYIEPPNRPSPTKKYKNEFTRKKFEEFYRKKAAYEEKKRSTQKANPDYELANIISSLATFHNSLNMANIWDLTVYQVHDTFARQRQKEYIDVSDHNYDVWGGKDHKMDMWFKHIS